uniref:Uncharacterized protein n=1 Tax=Arundo donax TaxID=35708 RepID=A0A0A9GUB8_ARUDO
MAFFTFFFSPTPGFFSSLSFSVMTGMVLSVLAFFSTFFSSISFSGTTGMVLSFSLAGFLPSFSLLGITEVVLWFPSIAVSSRCSVVVGWLFTADLSL